MKTAQKRFAQAINALKLEVPESIALSIFELHLQAMKEYATEAIKADREKIKAEKEISEEDGLETVAVYIIDNLPIELI